MMTSNGMHSRIAERKNISRFLVAAVCFLSLLLSIAGCSASTSGSATSEGAAHSGNSMSQRSTSDAQDGAADKAEKSIASAGTLVWTGFLNGKKTFTSAGCTESAENQLGSFIAPFQGKHLSTRLTPGPYLSFTIMPSGSITVVFTSRNKNSSPDNGFLRRGVTRSDGVSWGMKNGHYFLALSNFKIKNMNLKNQNEITLNGVLTCTQLTNG